MPDIHTHGIPDLKNLHNKIAADAGLSRVRVYCRECSHERMVRGAECLRNGWPKCCGATMSLDNPTNLKK